MKRRMFLRTGAQALLGARALAQVSKGRGAAGVGAPGRAAPGGAAPGGIGSSGIASIRGASGGAPVIPPLVLSVRDLGAVGDGAAKDTLAIQQTIDRASVLGGGEVLVPAGTYLTGALVLRSNVRLHLAEGAVLQGADAMAEYPLAQVRWEGRWIKGYPGFISAWDAENIAITGPGTIRGSEAIRGRVERPSGYRLPALMEFVHCRNVWVEGCATEQFGMWSTHPVLSQNVTFKNVSFKSGADGIDVDSCQHVTIDGCTFHTGDDCISLKSGRGEEAAAQIPTRPEITCEDVLITNCTFTDTNFACIGIGSETSGGVRGTRIEHCKFVGARSHAIYIKSRPGRGAFIEEIHCRDLDVSGVQAGFLRINNLNSGKSDEFNVPGEAGIPVFRNFSFRDVRVVDVPHLVQAAEVHPAKPLVGLTLGNITGTCAKGMTFANSRDVHLSGIAVTGFEGPLLATANVTGTGLNGVVALTELPKIPEAVGEPATPYRVH